MRKKEIERLNNIINSFREDLGKSIEFCTNEANGITNDKPCRVMINYLKRLKEILDNTSKADDQSWDQ